MIATLMRGRFCRIAYSYVKNREDALGIVHSAIVKALQSYTGLRAQSMPELDYGVHAAFTPTPAASSRHPPDF